MPVDERLLDLLGALKRREAQGLTVDYAEVCAAHPELRSDLERLHAVESKVEHFLGSLDSDTTMAPIPGQSTGPLFWMPDICGYEVKSRVASGGMGAVYRATDVRLGREVALKVIRPEKLSADLLARFQAEARAVAAMDHPLIVRVYEVGEYRTEEGAVAPYLAMEFVAGGTLESHIHEPMAACEAARVVQLLARAMAHAHARGVVHRDLKPGNVLVAKCGDEPALNAAIGQPKVTDFGLARQVEGGSHHTQDGTLLGTPAYMAPEQAEGRVAGPAADVYALGVILYRLLLGRVPFESPSITELLYKIAHVSPPSLEGVPQALAKICDDCLAKEPTRRPSATELAQRLEAFVVANGETVSRLTAPLAVSRPWRRRHLLLVAALTAALVLVALVTWMIRSPAKPAAVAPLSATLTVRVWAKDRGVRGLEIGKDARAVPVREDEGVQVEVSLSEPAHVFLLYVNGLGEVTPLFPWNKEKLEVEDVGAPPPERKVATLLSPPGLDAGWAMDDKVGLDTVVLLARREPWPVGRSMADAIGKLPGAPALNPFDVRVWDGGHKTEMLTLDGTRLKKDAVAIDDQLQRLAARLSKDFEVIRAVQFAHVAKR
jgi:serine/threonine protein kinase